MSQQELDRARQLLAGVIQGLSYNDELIVLAMHVNGRNDGAPQWRTRMPRLRSATPQPVDEEALGQERSAAVRTAESFFTSAQPPHTDILSTLFDVGEMVSTESRSRSRLVLFSDMQHSVPGFDMDREDGIPGAQWIDEQFNRNLLPPLSGLCIVVVGGDRATAHGSRVFRFWKAFMDRVHARLDSSNYKLTALDPADLKCQ